MSKKLKKANAKWNYTEQQRLIQKLESMGTFVCLYIGSEDVEELGYKVKYNQMSEIARRIGDSFGYLLNESISAICREVLKLPTKTNL